MQKILQISLAASIGLHGTVLIYKSPARLNVVQIATKLKASEHHVAKVLQKLAKKDILKSHKGPAGGFSLGKDAGNLSLLEIYETIEGPLADGLCPDKTGDCPFEDCLWGHFGEQTGKDFKAYLQNTMVGDF